MASSSGSVKVLSTWGSMFGVRVLMALKEKGVEYEYEEQDLSNKSALLLQSNPVHQKVPVLIHDGRPICESLIIMQYIDETWPSRPGTAPLLPHDPYQRALARFWADFVDKKLFEGFVIIFKNTEGEMMEKGRVLLKESMATLDDALKGVFGGGPYFGGNHVNLLDMALASYIFLFVTIETLANFKVLDESITPHLCQWSKVVIEHPSVKEVLATTPSDKTLEAVKLRRKAMFGISE